MRHRAVVMETGRARQKSCGPLDWVINESSRVFLNDADQSVGAGLLAKALCQSGHHVLTHRIREQARSHRGRHWINGFVLLCIALARGYTG